MRATALLIVLLVAIAALAASEHKRQNAGLPLVSAMAVKQTPSMLFAPCPLEPRNLPLTGERTA